jgi:hypothetical protein
VQFAMSRKDSLHAARLFARIKESVMKSTATKWVVKAAGAGALALVLAVPSYAQSRDNNRGGRDDNRDGRATGNSSYRDNQRVTAEGRVSSFSRERDGYRVQLEGRRDSYFVPQSHFGRDHSLRVGLSVRLGGIFRGSTIYVDAVNWPEDRDRGGRYDNRDGDLRGVIDRIDARNDTVWIRNARTRELVAVELRESRGNRNELRNLRRGDYVEVSGQWQRGGVFEAYRIDVL